MLLASTVVDSCHSASPCGSCLVKKTISSYVCVAMISLSYWLRHHSTTQGTDFPKHRVTYTHTVFHHRHCVERYLLRPPVVFSFFVFSVFSGYLLRTPTRYSDCFPRKPRPDSWSDAWRGSYPRKPMKAHGRGLTYTYPLPSPNRSERRGELV